jgi:ribosomal protein S18 acetylase RimI-like enzyme
MTSDSVNLVIRQAVPSDKDQWRELFLAYGQFYSTQFTPAITEGVWQWILEPNHPLTCWVADIEGALVGFAHVREQPDTFRAGPSWFLDDLFTAPQARNRGVARALINQAKAYAATNGGGDLRWITAADNHQAQRLYDTVAAKTTWVLYETDTTQEM